MRKAHVITVSDKGFSGEREDLSGPKIAEILKAAGFDEIVKVTVPDERPMIEAALISAAEQGSSLVLTTGGTGFSERDVTPEATLAVIEKNAFGISEAIRFNSLKYTDRAMLSRGVSGIRGRSLIVNLPGSPKAVEESLNFIIGPVMHGLDIMLAQASDCARK